MISVERKDRTWLLVIVRRPNGWSKRLWLTVDEARELHDLLAEYGPDREQG